MAAHTTVGVIGHVDHGKSALVKALTGIETDRLAEEQARGMSIVLGFAWMQRDKAILDLIDVPGHENFIRTMISGATGIQAVLLVVDACEGVMPQTREHLLVAQMLGVRRGVIAITKADLADDSLLAVCRADIKDAVAGSFLADAPTLEVSAVTGTGVDALADALFASVDADAPAHDAEGWYLPVDRSFSIDGFGTVVTGTLRRGVLRTGDRVAILPGHLDSTVRALQVHGEPVSEAQPGQRVAVNLRGIAREAVSRGDTLCEPGSLGLSQWLDVVVEFPASLSEVLPNSAQLRLLMGTGEVTCRLRLLDADAARTGGEYLAQLHCAAPVAACFGERFVLRTLSPATTVGGGRVLLADSHRKRRFDGDTCARLKALAAGDLPNALGMLVSGAGVRGIRIAELSAQLGAAQRVVESWAARADIERVGAELVTTEVFAASRQQLLDTVVEFHRNDVAAAGMGLAELRAQCAAWSDPLFEAGLQALVQQDSLEINGGFVRLPAHDSIAGLSESERALAASIEAAYRTSLFAPPDDDQICKDAAAKKMRQWLLEQKQLCRIQCKESGRTLVFHERAIAESVSRIAAVYPPPQPFRVSDVRELLGTTRKYLLPLLGYLDNLGITMRRGDLRSLRQR